MAKCRLGGSRTPWTMVEFVVQKRSSLEQLEKSALERLFGCRRQLDSSRFGCIIAELLLHLLFDQFVHVHLFTETENTKYIFQKHI